MTTQNLIGIAKDHTFENGNKVTNLTLFQDAVEKIEPVNGRFTVFVNKAEKDYTIGLDRGPESVYKLSFESKAFTPGLPGSALSENGYLNFTCVKNSKDGKDFMSVFQSRQEGKPLYVGNGFDVSKPQKNISQSPSLSGPTYYNDKAKFPFHSCLINKIDLATMNEKFFINVSNTIIQKEDKNQNFALYNLSDKPDVNAMFTLRVNKSDIEKNIPEGVTNVRVNFTDKNPEKISEKTLYSDLSVYTFQNNEKTYVGNGWTQDRFASLSSDQRDAISLVSKQDKGVGINDYVSFKWDSDFYLSQSGSTQAYGVVNDITGDGKLSISSPVGNITLYPSQVEPSKKLHYLNFNDAYSDIKNNINEQIKASQEHLQDKSKGVSPTKGVDKEMVSNKPTPSQDKSPKTQKPGQEMTM